MTDPITPALALLPEMKRLIDAREKAEAENVDRLNKTSPNQLPPPFEKAKYISDKAFFDWLNWHGERLGENGRQKLSHLITALEALQSGEWVAVPREPTYEMEQAGFAAANNQGTTPKFGDIYRAMIGAK